MRYLGAVSKYLDTSRYFDLTRAVQVYFAAGPDLTDAQQYAADDGAEVVDLGSATTITLQCVGVPQSVSCAIVAPQSGAGAGQDFVVTHTYDALGASLVQGACIAGQASFAGPHGLYPTTITITYPVSGLTGGSALITLTCR